MTAGSAAQRACPVCGRPFTGRPQGRYCSRACGNRADYASHVETRQAERRERYHRAQGTAPLPGGRAELRARIAAALMADPRRSDLEHARQLGVAPRTIGLVRAALVSIRAIPAVGWVVGRDDHPHVPARLALALEPADRRYRGWTVDEDRYLREHWGEPAREVAVALSRTLWGVLHRRRTLRKRQVRYIR